MKTLLRIVLFILGVALLLLTLAWAGIFFGE